MYNHQEYPTLLYLIWFFFGHKPVKYTTPLPFIDLCESDLKLRNNFEICEGKNHEHLKNIDLQSHKTSVDNNFLRESRHFVEDGASSVVVDIVNM